MPNLRFFFVLTLLLTPLFASAGSTYFTTVFYDDEGVVYAGLKRGEGAGESQIVTFPFPPIGTRTRIPLPPEISSRDIIGLITDRHKLFVLTGAGEEKNDGPMLHLFDRKKERWKKIGKVRDCATFSKAKLYSHKMVFYCERLRKRGRSRVVAKALHYGKERMYRRGTWRFPEFMLRYKGTTLLLEGRAPTWDKLRVKNENEERLINAEDILDLPAPLPPIAPPPSGLTPP